VCFDIAVAMGLVGGGEAMISGWYLKFPTDRLLRPDEWQARLPPDEPQPVAADQNLSLIAFNSTYIDILDRRYRQRGMMGTTLAVVGSLFVASACAWATSLAFEGDDLEPYVAFMHVLMAAMGVVGPWILWRAILSKDSFTSTWYPIRFNRKTRMVHFYMGREESVVSVPWNEGFFHVGKGLRETFLNDVRCHVMDGDVVKQTFAIGQYYDDERVIRALWEFIRRYMEDGPDAMDLPAHRRYISLSMAPTFKNSYTAVMTSIGVGLLPLRFVLMPLLFPLVVCRWLVMRSCSPPTWPEDIENESRIDADDPHRWREPSWSGEFVYEMEKDVYEGRSL